MPLAKAIVCLESPHSTPADVLVFFVAAVQSIKKKLDESTGKRQLSNLPKDAIFRILVKRFDEPINTMKKNGHNICFTAALLDPREF